MITWSRVEYTYDTWGKVLTATGNMADTNPIRYRGYYYDSDTELYYLQSRYYDPELCRFINADGYTTTDLKGILSSNMFAYCENNPTNRLDLNGADWKTAFAVGFTVAVIGLAVLATLPFSGPLLAGAGVAASTVAAVANSTVAAGLTVAGGSLIQAAINGKTSRSYDGKPTYKDNEKDERIEYEYYGNSNGNVHYELAHDKTDIWRLENGKETFYDLPQKISKIIMSNSKMQEAISRGIEIVKSLSGLF